MSDVTLTRVSLTNSDGEDITSDLQALSDSDTYYYSNADGKPVVYLISTDTVTVTVETTLSGAGQDLPNHTESMSNGDELLLGPRTPKYYNQSDGTVKITVSAAGVSAGVYVP